MQAVSIPKASWLFENYEFIESDESTHQLANTHAYFLFLFLFASYSQFLR